MDKAVLSPLFLCLIGLLVIQYRLYRRSGFGQTGHSRRRRPWELVLLSAITAGLWIGGTPVIAVQMARTLEQPFYNVLGSPSLHLPPGTADVVVVLSAGIDRGPTPAMDLLNGPGYARVWRGVQAFRESQARLLVMSGYDRTGSPERMTTLMKDLAVHLGVPPERVITELRSVNTRAHPRELEQLPDVKPTDTIAVVTSAWHLPRAMAEFRRYFTRLVPVPADFLSLQYRGEAADWLPNTESLWVTTRVLHEYIGRVWYTFRQS